METKEQIVEKVYTEMFNAMCETFLASHLCEDSKAKEHLENGISKLNTAKMELLQILNEIG